MMRAAFRLMPVTVHAPPSGVGTPALFTQVKSLLNTPAVRTGSLSFHREGADPATATVVVIGTASVDDVTWYLGADRAGQGPSP